MYYIEYVMVSINYNALLLFSSNPFVFFFFMYYIVYVVVSINYNVLLFFSSNPFHFYFIFILFYSYSRYQIDDNTMYSEA